MSAVGSSDSASTLHERLQRLPSGSGFEKDCSRSTLSGLMQDAANLVVIQTTFTPPMSQQLESSATYRSVASSDITSGWAVNDAPVPYFNGDYPNGYHLEWHGKHQQPLPSSQGGTTFTTSAHRTGPSPLPTSSWSPAPASRWPSNVAYVTHPQMITSGWPGVQLTGPCVSTPAQQQQQQQQQQQPPASLHSTLGKRGVSESGRTDGAQLPAKALRTEEYPRSFKSTWPMLGRNQSDVNATLKLFQPKLELGGACEQKDSFMGRLFTNSAGARPVPFPVTI